MSDSRGPIITGVAVAFGVLSAITISLRLWARIFLVRRMGPDDFLICVAVLLSWSFMVVTVLAVQHGMGRHITEVMPMGVENLSSYAEVVWLSSIFYNATLGFIKISVLALYMRLGDRLLRRLAIMMIVVVSCQAGGNVLACIFQCSPIRAAYDQTITSDQKTCVNINAFYLANAAVNIFTDLLTYTLPIKLIINLQVPKRQKIGLAVILCLGLFACISSIIRITFIPTMLTSTDATYVISDAMYWSVIETNIGILAASIPSFKPIASRYAPRLLGSSYHNRRTAGGGGGGYGYGNQSGSKPPRSRSSPFSSLSFGGSRTRARAYYGGGSRSGTVELTSMERADDHFVRNQHQHQQRGGKDGGAGAAEKSLDGGLRHYHHPFTGIKKTGSVIAGAEKDGDHADNSSEEVLYIAPPEGQITVKTQIETRYESS